VRAKPGADHQPAGRSTDHDLCPIARAIRGDGDSVSGTAGEVTMDSGEAAIRQFLDEQNTYGARYRRALARRLGLDPHEAAALLHVVLAGRLTADELRLALVLPADEAVALVERMVAGGLLVRSTGQRGEEFEIALPTLERLAELTRPLVEDLDALATRLSPDERAIVGRFLEEVVAVNERHAEDAARQAMEQSS
jgi:DNA-binding MarR family transcriptional regulator